MKDRSFVGDRGTNISYNSKKSMRESKGIVKTQLTRVSELLADGKARNSRQIANELRIERTAITRALKTLQERNQIKVSHDAPCPQTGRTVGYYVAMVGEVAVAQ